MYPYNKLKVEFKGFLKLDQTFLKGKQGVSLYYFI